MANSAYGIPSKATKMKISEKYLFVLDLDGVLTDGKFYYSSAGKILKAFGADDNDALKSIAQFFEIIVVTADRVGFEISKKRVTEDMGLPLFLVPAKGRGKWISEKYPSRFRIYMGDGIFDPQVFQEVDYSIAPANASRPTQEAANFVTNQCGGDRAVAEACTHIANKFFEYDILESDPLSKDSDRL